MHGEKRFVLDTNVIIGILADKTPLPAEIRLDPPIAISVISEIETRQHRYWE